MDMDVNIVTFLALGSSGATWGSKLDSPGSGFHRKFSPFHYLLLLISSLAPRALEAVQWGGVKAFTGGADLPSTTISSYDRSVNTLSMWIWQLPFFPCATSLQAVSVFTKASTFGWFIIALLFAFYFLGTGSEVLGVQRFVLLNWPDFYFSCIFLSSRFRKSQKTAKRG